MSDALADMLLEQEASEAAESEGRVLLMERLTEIRDAIRKLQASVDTLVKLERAEQMQRTIEVTERDEFDRIKRITLN